MPRYDNCGQCPKYHHAGAFGSPRYKPMCGKKTLPHKVEAGYAIPLKVICHRLKD